MRTVQLFVTCLVDTFLPEVGEAMVSVLEAAGARVEFARDQTCCGQPPFNAGLRSEARKIAEHTISVFESTAGDIVMPSGSCAHMIRHNYTELFAGEASWQRRSAAISARTYEFTEYLVDVLGIADCGARWDGPLTYHPTCHLHRGLGIDRQPKMLLEHVDGSELRDLPEAEDCCGFGGIFSVEHPELSGEMLKRKLGNLAESEAPTLVVGDAGCLMHIQGGLHRQKMPQRVVHIAQVLAQRGSR